MNRLWSKSLRGVQAPCKDIETEDYQVNIRTANLATRQAKSMPTISQLDR